VHAPLYRRALDCSRHSHRLSATPLSSAWPLPGEGLLVQRDSTLRPAKPEAGRKKRAARFEHGRVEGNRTCIRPLPAPRAAPRRLSACLSRAAFFIRYTSAKAPSPSLGDFGTGTISIAPLQADRALSIRLTFDGVSWPLFQFRAARPSRRGWTTSRFQMTPSTIFPSAGIAMSTHMRRRLPACTGEHPCFALDPERVSSFGKTSSTNCS